jgi:FkbM family methyltransferase
MANPVSKIAHNKFGYYCVPLSSAYTITSDTILRGMVHEPSTIDFIIENSNDGDIIHAGTGFGDFLPAISSKKKSKIWTFEPNPLNFKCTEETIKLNGLKNIELFQCALGDRNYSGKLIIAENGKELGVRSQMLGSQESDKNNDCEFVEIRTIDSIIPNERKVSLIHLDTEGYEEVILRGADKVIKKNSPLIVLEIHSEALKYNNFMNKINYRPIKHLIYDSGPIVFINTVYKKCGP